MDVMTKRKYRRAERVRMERIRRETEWRQYKTEQAARQVRFTQFMRTHFADWPSRSRLMSPEERTERARSLAVQFYDWAQVAKCRTNFDTMSKSDMGPEHWYVGGLFADGWLLADVDPAPHGFGHWELVVNRKGKLVVWTGGYWLRYRARDPEAYLGYFLEDMPERIANMVSQYPETPWPVIAK
jgi:hypothetical protein